MLIEGRRLILGQGYTATAVDAICDAASVTKGAFFHHFASKDEFASQVLAFTWAPVPEMHDDLDPALPPAERLTRHIIFMAEWIAESGRLMPLLAQELGSSNSDIRSQVGGYFAAWMGYLDDLLDAAGEKAPADVDLIGLKQFIVATTEGIPVVRNQFGPESLGNVAAQLVAAVEAALSS